MRRRPSTPLMMLPMRPQQPQGRNDDVALGPLSFEAATSTENRLCLWKYPSMDNFKVLKSHKGRVLYLAQSPSGEVVCSGSGADETLRFWKIWDAPPKKKKGPVGIPSLGVGGLAGIR